MFFFCENGTCNSARRDSLFSYMFPMAVTVQTGSPHSWARVFPLVFKAQQQERGAHTYARAISKFRFSPHNALNACPKHHDYGSIALAPGQRTCWKNASMDPYAAR